MEQAWQSRMRADNAGSPLTVGDQAVAGVGAGLAAAAIACPTELIKCRLQAQAGSRSSSVSPARMPLALALPGTTPGVVQVLNFQVCCCHIFSVSEVLTAHSIAVISIMHLMHSMLVVDAEETCLQVCHMPLMSSSHLCSKCCP